MNKVAYKDVAGRVRIYRYQIFIICKLCKKEFKSNTNSRFYCSRKCKYLLHDNERLEKKSWICTKCNTKKVIGQMAWFYRRGKRIPRGECKKCQSKRQMELKKL